MSKKINAEDNSSDSSTEKGRWLRILKKVLLFCKENSGLIVAGATIALAVITYSYINEAKKMREATVRVASETKKMATETKRLADISIEQFKIKAYPTFVIDVRESSIDSTGIKKVFKVFNKGEITAHNVTFLIADVYKMNNHFHFSYNWGAIYEFDEEVNAISFESKIWAESDKTIISRVNFVEPYTFEKLKCAVLYIKFKVPYDEKYRYEVNAYALKKITKKLKPQEEPYYLQNMSVADTDALIKINIATNVTLPAEAKKLIGEFFCDFSVGKEEKEDRSNKERNNTS